VGKKIPKPISKGDQIRVASRLRYNGIGEGEQGTSVPLCRTEAIRRIVLEHRTIFHMHFAVREMEQMLLSQEI
jgi:hypothetical protein